MIEYTKKQKIKNILDNLIVNENFNVNDLKLQLKEIILETPAVEIKRKPKINMVTESNGTKREERENVIESIRIIFINENDEVETLDKKII